MVTKKNIITFFVLFFLSLSLVSCGGISKPTSFFMLTPIQTDSILPQDGLEQVSVLVGPVTVAAYLNRDQIISQQKGSKMLVHDFDHWAEPLNHNLKRVLIANLSSLLSSAEIYDFDRRSSISTHYQVEVDIQQLDFTVEGTAVLMGFWSIFDNKGTLLQREKAFLQIASTGGDVDSKVAALNKCVSDFSRQVAEAIASQNSQQEGS